jgi:hypothetical protein
MADTMPPLCLFCLEELKENQGVPNLVGCGCELHTHSACLHLWFDQKQQLECPICHRVSIPNPMQSMQEQQQREIVIIRIQDPEREDQLRRLQSQEKCVGFCCLFILIWWIGAIIMEFAIK